MASTTGAEASGTAGQSTSIGSGLSNLVSKIIGIEQPKKDPRTRFIVSLSKATPFQVTALERPNRVVVDMGRVNFLLPSAPDKQIGVVTSFRGGLASADKTRIVINVSEPVVINRALIRDNPKTRTPELVIDILPLRAKAAFEAQQSAERSKVQQAAMGLGIKAALPKFQPPTPKPAASPQELRKKSAKPLIVVDPGHGGRDSGAKRFGLQEKNVVLKFGLKLRDKLLATGRYRVIMTRSTDIFIPLGRRISLAERNNADLFISVHADYAGSRARGATIYSLRQRTAARLRGTARKEVTRQVLTKLSKGEMSRVQKVATDVGTIQKILTDLAQREVENNWHRTTAISDNVVKYMSGSTNMRRDPDKRAGFRVLRTAKVPSILIELAYISNRRDARNLNSDKWRERVATSISEAVDRYFSDPTTRFPL